MSALVVTYGSKPTECFVDAIDLIILQQRMSALVADPSVFVPNGASILRFIALSQSLTELEMVATFLPSYVSMSWKVISVSSVGEAPKPPEVTEAPEAPEVTEAPEAPEVTEAPEAPEAPEVVPEELMPTFSAP